MIIEFIGAPGAGKTTLLPGVIQFFESRDYRAYTVVEAARPFARRTIGGKIVQGLAPLTWQPPLLWRVFYLLSIAHRWRFGVQRPQLIGQVLASQKRRPAAADARRREVLPWFFRHAGYYEFLRGQARPDEVLVFDEGFIHRVVQLYSSSAEKPAQARIDAYVDLLPPPDMVIYVQASTAVCEQRIYERGLWPRARHKEPAEISRFVSHAHRAVELAVAHARRKRWLVLEVVNDGADLTAVQAHLRQQLAQFPLERRIWEIQTAS